MECIVIVFQTHVDTNGDDRRDDGSVVLEDGVRSHLENGHLVS